MSHIYGPGNIGTYRGTFLYMKWIYDSTYEDLGKDFRNLGFSPYMVDQVFLWLYRKNNHDIDSWSNISLNNRGILREKFDVHLPAVKKIMKDRFGTQKLLLSLHDGREVEAVLIPEKHHYTLCISSQVGCGLGCKFCATGTMGLIRNLSSGEILTQVLLLKKQLNDYSGKLNIVFMGMGEPLLNEDAVAEALKIMTWDKGLNISPRNITVSTAGILAPLKRFEQKFPRVKLSFSLNAADQEERARLMPVARKEKLAEILNYFKTGDRKHRITLEYVLIKDVNASSTDARKLAKLIKGIRCKVNLIPYNENECFEYRSPEPDTVDSFGEYLSSRGYTVMVRWSRGKDIHSACGQLATQSGYSDDR